jgi:hypothetical protein
MTADEPRTPESLLPAPAEGREERVDLGGWDAHILRWGQRAPAESPERS